MDDTGLSAGRQRGFLSQDRVKPDTRVPTTNLHDMQAKEGALVSKFMTFLCRKNFKVLCVFPQYISKQQHFISALLPLLVILERCFFQ